MARLASTRSSTHAGPYRARYLMLSPAAARAPSATSECPSLRSTDYINTIPPEREPWFPGDEAIERRIRAYIRWNAAIMVHRAQRPGVGVGGHISTYASTRLALRGRLQPLLPRQGPPRRRRPDLLPGPRLARHLRARLPRGPTDRAPARRLPPGAVAPGRRAAVLPAPAAHARLLGVPDRVDGARPDQRDLPGAVQQVPAQPRHQGHLASSTCGPSSATARWTSPSRCGAIGLAAREELDNLTFVVNCNLQRLDGPVRGNGKIIQELESFFRGAGWNVIKVIWGREWDPLLAADTDGALVNLMNTHARRRLPDLQGRGRRVRPRALLRPRSAHPQAGRDLERRPDLDAAAAAATTTARCTRPTRAATEHTGQPTVILAKTIKGWTLGSHFEGRNSTHQMKKLTLEDLKGSATGCDIPIPDSDLDANLPPYYHPGVDHEHIQYLHERRRALGGYVPERRPYRRQAARAARRHGLRRRQARLGQAADRHDDGVRPSAQGPAEGTSHRPAHRADHPRRGAHLRHGLAVPDVPRSTRRTASTTPSVDRDLFLSYKEAKDGQILHEGINEAGSAASFTAVGHVVRHARRADDPGLHLLLDVRLPAHRRRVLGRGRPDGARLRPRRHRRAARR